MCRARRNSQLKAALVALCRDDPLKVVKNSESGSGLDSWRRLTKAYDPIDPHSNLNMLQKLLAPEPVVLGSVMSSIETWEKMYKEYLERSGEGIGTASKILCLKRMCPTDLRKHLDLNAAKLTTYETEPRSRALS